MQPILLCLEGEGLMGPFTGLQEVLSLMSVALLMAVIQDRLS